MIVRERIHRVIVLVDIIEIWVLLAHDRRHVHVMSRRVSCDSSRSYDDLSTVSSWGRLLLLTTLRVRDDLARIPTLSSEERNGTSSIARRSSDDSHAFSETSLSLSIVENVLGNAILNRTSWVQMLALHEYLNASLSVRVDVLQLDETSVADQTLKGILVTGAHSHLIGRGGLLMGIGLLLGYSFLCD